MNKNNGCNEVALKKLCKMTNIPAWKIKKALVTSEEWKRLTEAANIIANEEEGERCIKSI